MITKSRRPRPSLSQNPRLNQVFSSLNLNCRLQESPTSEAQAFWANGSLGVEEVQGPKDSLPIWKRGVDISVIILTLPIVVLLSAAVYCWIQTVSPGNVLFRQKRIGRFGKPFSIYKFRSMQLGASVDVHESHMEHLIKTNHPMTKLDMIGDTRLIRGGFLIRTSGLDELPQLINVLRGEMSLVGPRPCLPKEFELYQDHQRQRFLVRPGVTGQWQVNRSIFTTFSEMVAMDEDYVANHSPLLDFKIIFKTPTALLGQLKLCIRSGVRGGFGRVLPSLSEPPRSQCTFDLSTDTASQTSD